MKRLDLNEQHDKLNGDSYFGRTYLMKLGNKVHSNSKPVNEFYWVRFDSIDDKAIGMHNIRFVNYCDLYNNLVKPFRK